jgi:IS5 family transposase
MSFRAKIRSEGVKPLIKHRVFAPSDHAHNARIEDDLYNQRLVCETVNSMIKRSDDLMASTRSENWLRIRGVEACSCLFTDSIGLVNRNLYAFPQIHRIDACINLFYTL